MDEVAASLGRLMALIYEEELRLLRAVGRSITEHYVMQVLATHPGSSVSGLAQRLSLAKSSVSFVVDELVKKNLVTREHDLTDRRKVVVSLTDKGRESVSQFWSAKADLLGEAMVRLSPEDRRVVERVFLGLTESVQQRLGEK